MAATPERRLHLRLQGVVQGVGFRPWSARLAGRLGLRGWVRNDAAGLELTLEGPAAQLQRFLGELEQGPPARCRIDRLERHWSVARGEPADFRILAPRQPRRGGIATALISPDLAICRRCLAELAEPHNRRHRYPFISCTDCGPRYSLLRRLPFERAHTSLAAFPLCADCRRDYDQPENRRFHAQTISCPTCGPRLRGLGHTDPAAALAAAAAALQRGEIVAIQGIGGFQLLVDAGNGDAVAELRRRKGRPHKPLALLADATWLRRCCQPNAALEALWWSAAAPIVLMRPRPELPQRLRPARAVSGDSPWLGVMRPASGLHQLLLDAVGGGALVATSANRSGEPIARDAEADAVCLAQLADGVLHHDLPIVNRIDDSVVRLAAGEPLVLRLGRGLAPIAVAQPMQRPGIGALALGAQLKGSLAIQLPRQLLLSPDLGDLGSAAGAEHLRHTTQDWLQRHGLSPRTIGCDAHAGYSSSQLAADLASSQGLPLQRVRHHHAHLLAVMAEHGLNGEQLGVAWDGSGLGDDGSLWGGEALAVRSDGYRRLARLRPFPLPGGELALREPRRAALGLLISAGGPDWQRRVTVRGRLPWRHAFTPEACALLEQAVARGFNSPLCSSVGRLFDAVAALLGVQQRCSYEAQAAMALEGLATTALEAAEREGGRNPVGTAPRYRLPLRPDGDADLLQWDWRPMLDQLLLDLADPAQPAATIALEFHRGLAAAIAALAERQASGAVVLLSGGCFQNQLLLELSVAELRARGFTPLWPQRLPCNDAALAAGQLLALAALPITRAAPRAARHVSRRPG